MLGMSPCARLSAALTKKVLLSNTGLNSRPCCSLMDLIVVAFAARIQVKLLL